MRIIIFANGSLPDLEKARALLRPDDFILCADGGTRHALALGLTPNLIIGDLDSTTLDLRPLTQKGMQVIRHPADKNETDLELAIEHALTLNPNQILILAALGGRMDQTLANISLLGNSSLVTRNLRITDGVEELFFCRDQVQVEGRSGDIVSLIPWQGEVTGVFTENLRWHLHHETLYPDKTRGISNEMTADVATVSITSGLLLIIHTTGN
ncbi:MAG: thiamine diphosphokinase [Chloroflexi bacterium]|nr:thiamine diphosphokinase [Chloroflexota bacterium]MDL1941347.1 thiamine diphosphokinase [Chloroflexi bacterium CFX2]